MDETDHHLLVGKGAQEFARGMGFKIEDDLNTDELAPAWLEWKRRTDPLHYLDPEQAPGGDARRSTLRDDRRGARSIRDHFYGTINCDGVNAKGEICGVTTTSGLAWKIPGRVGDSPILGAGLYVDGEVGAAGSTGRGEANLYNLCSFLIVEEMRRGAHPKDAGMEALKRITSNTVEKRLLNSRTASRTSTSTSTSSTRRASTPAWRCTGGKDMTYLVLRPERSKDDSARAAAAGGGVTGDRSRRQRCTLSPVVAVILVFCLPCSDSHLRTPPHPYQLASLRERTGRGVRSGRIRGHDDPPGQVVLVPTGLVIEVPAGMFLGIFARSSTPLKRGLMVANGVGVVDPDYCGPADEVKIAVLNFTAHPVTVSAGDRIAQGILLPATRVQWLESGPAKTSSRGGFGSTG